MGDHVKDTTPASWLTLARRGKLYRIAAALGAVLIFYGVLTAEALGVWLGLAASLLGNVTAAAYTPATGAGGDVA